MGCCNQSKCKQELLCAILSQLQKNSKIILSRTCYQNNATPTTTATKYVFLDGTATLTQVFNNQTGAVINPFNEVEWTIVPCDEIITIDHESLEIETKCFQSNIDSNIKARGIFFLKLEDGEVVSSSATYINSQTNAIIDPFVSADWTEIECVENVDYVVRQFEYCAVANGAGVYTGAYSTGDKISVSFILNPDDPLGTIKQESWHNLSNGSFPIPFYLTVDGTQIIPAAPPAAPPSADFGDCPPENDCEYQTREFTVKDQFGNCYKKRIIDRYLNCSDVPESSTETIYNLDGSVAPAQITLRTFESSINFVGGNVAPQTLQFSLDGITFPYAYQLNKTPSQLTVADLQWMVEQLQVLSANTLTIVSVSWVFNNISDATLTIQYTGGTGTEAWEFVGSEATYVVTSESVNYIFTGSCDCCEEETPVQFQPAQSLIVTNGNPQIIPAGAASPTFAFLPGTPDGAILTETGSITSGGTPTGIRTFLKDSADPYTLKGLSTFEANMTLKYPLTYSISAGSARLDYNIYY